MAIPTFSLKSNFFDAPKITRAVSAATRKALIPSAAQTRTIAQYSMRPARRIKMSEMTPEIAEQMGLPREGYKQIIRRQKLKLPYKSSNPGEAPRTRRAKTLKRRLFFAFDKKANAAVVGPEQYGPNAAKLLERGGITIMKTKRRIRKKPYKSTPKQRKALQAAIESGRVRSGRKTRKKSDAVKVITVRRIKRIKKRPYMGPALKKVIPTIPDQFKGMLR